MKLGTQHHLIYFIVLKWFEFKTIVIWLKLRAKMRFYGFLNVFGAFSNKVVQTWHKTLFSIHYCVEMV